MTILSYGMHMERRYSVKIKSFVVFTRALPMHISTTTPDKNSNIQVVIARSKNKRGCRKQKERTFKVGPEGFEKKRHTRSEE